jgi:4-amino-4-deoxy-L-arabinose transferase-like glycosyltransferase
LTVFLIVSSVFVFLKTQRQNSIYLLLVSGFLIGVAILVKPTLLPFPFLLLLVAGKISIPRRHLILMPLAALIVIVPWMTRNLLVLDTLSLSTNVGMNLYVGNNPSATGSYRGVFPNELSDTSVNEITRNELALKLALEHIVTHPGTFVVNGIKKIAHVFRSEGDALIGSFSPYSSLDKVGFKDQYRSLPIVVVAATNLSYYFLLLLGIAGFLASERGRLFWFTTVLFASSLLVYFVFFGGSRFHFPLMPFAALYAAEAAVSLIDRRFVLSGKEKLLFLLSSTALVSLWSYELILIYLIH